MLFTESKDTVSIKYFKGICSESTLSITLNFIDVHYVNHGSSNILVWIQIITKYTYLVFEINGPLYYASVWIPTQIWSSFVMTEFTPFLEKYVISIGCIQPASFITHTMVTKCQHRIT